MFDSYSSRTYVTEQRYPQTIHNHRAPTDESIKILNEMQEKAEKNLLAKHIVGENSISGVEIELATNCLGKQVWIGFDLNGRKHLARCSVDPLAAELSPGETYRRIVTKLAEEIVRQIVTQNPEPLFKLFRTGRQ